MTRLYWICLRYRYKKRSITRGLLCAHDNPSHPTFNSPFVYQRLYPSFNSPFVYQKLYPSFNSPFVYQRLYTSFTVLLCAKDYIPPSQSFCVPKTTERFVISLHTMHYRYSLLCDFMKIGATMDTLFSLSNLSKHQPYSHAITFSIVTK